MDWRSIGPFLDAELERHDGAYEKFLLGTRDAGRYYCTAGGNPTHGGLASFDDGNPNAKPRSISKRDYWQSTVGDNTRGEPVAYVSDPMISYATGVRQVVVAATILSEGGQVLGMVGGSLPWRQIEARVNQVRAEILHEFGRSAKLCLVSRTGTYMYHWDPEKTTRLKRDARGEPVLNEIGEKVAVRKRITDESNADLAQAGAEMAGGEAGVAFYADSATGEDMAIVYSPVKSANYALAMVVPKSKIIAPVVRLRGFYTVITLASVVLVVSVSLFVARSVTKPIVALSTAAKGLAGGDWDAELTPVGNDEVSELTRTFNEMASSLKARERALRKSEGMFRAITENTADATVILDGKSVYQYASPSVRGMLGYRPEEIVGRTPDLFVHPDDLPGVGEVLRRAQREPGKTFHLPEFRVRDRGERWVTLDGLVTGMLDVPSVEGVVVNFRDVTERKQAEERIRNSESKFRGLFESNSDALVLYAAEGGFLDCNEAALRLFGCSTRNELLARHPGEFSPPRQADGQDSRAGAAERVAAAHQKGCTQFEWLHSRKDGTVFPAEVVLNTMILNERQVLLAVVRDISERKRAEEELRQFSEKQAEARRRLEVLVANTAEREKRMVDLKQEVNDLLGELGLAPKYQAPLEIVEQGLGNTVFQSE